MKPLPALLAALTLSANAPAAEPREVAPAADPFAWPAVTRESRPWSYWWWLGSAVDTTNLTRELTRYREAGWGGVHIIPIYGAKGWEERYLDYLSPAWLAMLRHTIQEGNRLDLGVDMTTGTGWCFGGPGVTDREANAVVVAKTFEMAAGGRLTERFDPASTQALMAFGSAGDTHNLKGRLTPDGRLDWTAPDGDWRIYVVSQKPSGRKVKRAAPGGGGHMLNLFHEPAMVNYLKVFTEAFADPEQARPRSMYHDSYEYVSNWSPDLFAAFARRRGYRLEDELPALFSAEGTERAARVQCDLRETLSDLLIEGALPRWVEWCHSRGMRTRNQAHGSPGNLLDLYALADIPETEMFHLDRNRLVSKLASSAAHVTGRRLVSAETGTWLKEHFTETLADMKYLVDDLFLSGVNHVFYHGTCYSPDEAPWPGWLFYASYEMNPRNPVWRDVPALNASIARCQSVLQSGAPDADVLLYWPIHEVWQRTGSLEQKFTVHARDWLEEQPFGRAADRLWQSGFDFDYVSDRQLGTARVADGRLRLPGGDYRVVVVPRCRLLPPDTLRGLLALATSGATIVFEESLPTDVPGWGRLDQRRQEFKTLLARSTLASLGDSGLQAADLGRGRVLVGRILDALAAARIDREPLVDHAGLWFARRRSVDGWHYFLANRGETTFDGWLPLARPSASVVVMDPMTGRTGRGRLRTPVGGSPVSVSLRLHPGESVILRAFERALPQEGPAWQVLDPAGAASDITGEWTVRFLEGGPELPAAITTGHPGSWTDLGDDDAQRFAGTAVYSVRFDAPRATAGQDRWMLDLGDVRQSARVRLNGRELATLLVPPYTVPAEGLRPKDNALEIEVTGVAANRIRDLDRRGVAWRTFHDINFVNLDYKPFDASDWPVTPSGLLGPVRLIPVRERSAR
ncbi:MAG: hypothetical protein H7A45_04970 [Verrucomicrobiales bacterium]|nr:hypothetical protein [Verrucomicrobiales bacterium]MCP5527729.1 hypothetical protein [Verrucomicrobiales bacterium]